MLDFVLKFPGESRHQSMCCLVLSMSTLLRAMWVGALQAPRFNPYMARGRESSDTGLCVALDSSLQSLCSLAGYVEEPLVGALIGLKHFKTYLMIW